MKQFWRTVVQGTLVDFAKKYLAVVILGSASVITALIPAARTRLRQDLVTLPVWGALLVLITLGVMGWLAWPRIRRLIPWMGQRVPSPVKLPDLQKVVMRVFYTSAEERLKSGYLLQFFGHVDAYRVLLALDRLEDMDLLKQERGEERSDRAYKVTQRGRTFCVELEDAIEHGKVELSSPELVPTTQDVNLTDLQLEILVALRKEDGEAVRRDHLERETQTSRLQMEQALEGLERWELVTVPSHQTSEMPEYILSQKGRDLLLRSVG